MMMMIIVLYLKSYYQESFVYSNAVFSAIRRGFCHTALYVR